MPTLLVPPPGWIDPHNWTPNADILPWLNVQNFGGDPYGVNASDNGGANAFSELSGASGIIYFPALTNGATSGANYVINTGLTYALAGNQTLGVVFDPGVTVSYFGNTDCIRMFGDFTGVHSQRSGVWGNPLIDATGAGANAGGIHIGDIFQARVEASFRNFTGANAIGLHWDNTIGQTEQSWGRVSIKNCTNGVVYDVSGATTSTSSFARPIIDIMCESTNAVPGHNGLVVQNGASFYGGRLGMYGNYPANPTSAAGSVITITGTIPAGHPNAGAFSRVQGCFTSIDVETTANTFVPTTITFGAAGNLWRYNFGPLNFEDFGTGTQQFVSSNVQTVGAVFQHTGNITGDAALVSSNYSGTRALGAIVTGGTIAPQPGGTVSVNPAGAVTGIIIGVPTSARDGLELWIENLSAFTVTFAAAGTSNVAAGVSATVPAQGNRLFKWNAAAALWIGGV